MSSATSSRVDPAFLTKSEASNQKDFKKIAPAQQHEQPQCPQTVSQKTTLSLAKKKNRKIAAVQKPRTRLNHEQKARLEIHFSQNPFWNNQEIQTLARALELSFTKVYKWNWERKKKDSLKYQDFTLQELAELYPKVQSSSEYAHLIESEPAEDTVSDDKHGNFAYRSIAP